MHGIIKSPEEENWPRNKKYRLIIHSKWPGAGLTQMFCVNKYIFPIWKFLVLNVHSSLGILSPVIFFCGAYLLLDIRAMCIFPL